MPGIREVLSLIMAALQRSIWPRHLLVENIEAQRREIAQMRDLISELEQRGGNYVKKHGRILVLADSVELHLKLTPGGQFWMQVNTYSS